MGEPDPEKAKAAYQTRRRRRENHDPEGLHTWATEAVTGKVYWAPRGSPIMVIAGRSPTYRLIATFGPKSACLWWWPTNLAFDEESIVALSSPEAAQQARRNGTTQPLPSSAVDLKAQLLPGTSRLVLVGFDK